MTLQGHLWKRLHKKNVAYQLADFVGSKSTMGLQVKLDLSPLDDFLDTLTNANFNQVTLEIGPWVGGKASSRPPHFQIMYFTNEINKILLRRDGYPMSVQPDGRIQVDPITSEPFFPAGNPNGWTPALLSANFTTSIFSQFMTSHVNAIYRKKMIRRDLLFHPGTPVSDDFIRNLKEYVVRQNSMKLKIFYSRSRSL